MNHSQKTGVYIRGVGQLKVEKESPLSLRQMGAHAIGLAMKDAQIESVDALYIGNMLSGILSHQQQLSPIVASASGLEGIEAYTIEAACGSGGAALRNGFMSIMSGACDTIVVCGLEKMSHPDKYFITQSIATASDWETEGGKGESFVTLNAKLAQQYLEAYKLSADCFAQFGINAHRNAMDNEHALFHKPISLQDYLQSKIIAEPLRLYDASPICDGCAAVVLSRFPSEKKDRPQVKITASTAATEAVGIENRKNPLAVEGIQRSGKKALQLAGVSIHDIDFFELHDAYSIIAILSLEGMGFAEKGKGWQLAEEGAITREGRLPISMFGGLKARGHPIGASGVYQTVESFLQLTHQAGANTITHEARIGLIQNIGGTASTVITHVLERE